MTLSRGGDRKIRKARRVPSSTRQVEQPPDMLSNRKVNGHKLCSIQVQDNLQPLRQTPRLL